MTDAPRDENLKKALLILHELTTKDCAAPTHAELAVQMEIQRAARVELEALTRPTAPSDEAALILLPRKPTTAMIDAAMEDEDNTSNAGVNSTHAIWCAMTDAFLAARASTTAGGAEDAEAQCERAVGRFIYNRVSELMNAKAGTPEGVELAYLAQIVTDVEEYGADGSEPRGEPVPTARDGDAVCTTCRWKGNHSPDCPRKDEPWPTFEMDAPNTAREGAEEADRLATEVRSTFASLPPITVTSPARNDGAELTRLRAACAKQNEEICQTLGRALGYPWYKDDQANFPGTTEADGVCVGEHVAETLAEEAAARLTADELREAAGALQAARRAHNLNMTRANADAVGAASDALDRAMAGKEGEKL